MQPLSRPDLTDLPAEVVAYIEELESRAAALESRFAGRARSAERAPEAEADESPEPSEPPTTLNVVTISAAGLAKRTPRHLYPRQRRGGMGIFDLDSPDGDPPAFLLVADQSAGLLLLTNHGRAFRAQVQDLLESPVRERGKSLLAGVPLRPGERLAVVIPDSGGAFLLLVTERGQIRRIAGQFVGRSLQPGTVIHDPKEGGGPAAACWSSGSDDAVILTREGKAIRFAERLIPVRGCLGLRVDPGESVAAVVASRPEGSVLAFSADGKGALRALETFAANKAPGSGGKAFMKTDALIGAFAALEEQDVLIVSRLGKLIRFRTAEVPPKEGPVQGVNCMALRADACTAATVTLAGGRMDTEAPPAAA